MSLIIASLNEVKVESRHDCIIFSWHRLQRNKELLLLRLNEAQRQLQELNEKLTQACSAKRYTEIEMNELRPEMLQLERTEQQYTT